MKKTNIAVFCSSNNNIGKTYINITKSLTKIISQYDINLIYGGGSDGLMGIVAKSLKDAKKQITGVILKCYYKDTEDDLCDNIIICNDLWERKSYIIKHSELFIILPGGIGTIDEFLDVVSAKYIKIIDNPIIIFNFRGIYNQIIRQMKTLYKHNLIPVNYLTLCDIANNLEDMKKLINKYCFIKQKEENNS